VKRIHGLRYLADYVDQSTHDRLLDAVDRQPWQRSVDHRVQVYGYHYSRRLREAFRIGDLPAWAIGLAGRLHDEGYIGQVPNQLVANDYEPGAGIFAHIDQAAFGDVVVSISLGSSCVMRFTESESGAADDMFLEPKSALVLAGEARWRWTHEIPGRLTDTWRGRDHPRSRRVSLTFRTVPDATRP